MLKKRLKRVIPRKKKRNSIAQRLLLCYNYSKIMFVDFNPTKFFLYVGSGIVEKVDLYDKK